jgi:branched-chain amino acid transport system ATP-binding protein
VTAHVVATGVSKHYAGVRALDGADLEVARGARHAIIGPNGAGKSTLFSVISGANPPTKGTVHLLGEDTTTWAAHQVARLGVSRTFQHSARFAEETVLDNCLLAANATHGRGARWRRFGRDAGMHRTAERSLEAVGLRARRHDLAADLSHGEARQLEIAMAISQEPQVLLADEPLAGLSEADRARVGKVLHDLPDDLTVVFVEHDLEFVLGLADRVTVLHLGQVIAEGTPDQVRADARVAEVYVGGQAGEVRERPLEASSAAPALRAEGLVSGYGPSVVLHGVDVEVPQGRVLAVLGRNGMGKTTLLKTLMGVVPAREGSVSIAGDDVSGLGARARAGAGLSLVPQGRGIIPGLSVEEQLQLSARPGRWTLERVLELFPVLGDRRAQSSTTLSGGEQQMLAVARSLLRNPSVLLLDEPSEGLAPMIVTRIGEIVRTLADEGETIVLAEQNVPMALSVADEVAILDRGRIVHRSSAAALRQDEAAQHRYLGV